ncbi:MAG: cohesin domain-containing protein [Saprospiraceae bacterium]
MTDCYRFQYGCYFSPNNGNQATTLNLVSLAFKATLIKPACGISSINVAQTKSCLMNTYGFTEDQIDVTESYVVINKMEGQGPYSFPLNGSPFMGIVVEAFPGEPLDLMFTDDLLQWDTGTGILNCTLPNTGCPAGATSVTFPESSTCTSLPVAVPNIIFDAEIPTSPNAATTQYSVPVVMQAGAAGYNFNELDFAIHLTANHTISAPGFTAVTIPGTSISVRTCSATEYIVYVHTTNYDYNPSPATLFRLLVNGPVMQSTLTDVDLNFISGRALRQNETTCCKPLFGNVKTVVFGQFLPCADGVNFDIAQVTNGSPASGDNCEARFSVKVNWPDALGSPLTFNQIKIIINLTLPPNASIVGFLNQTLTPNCPTCYSINGNSIEYLNMSGGFQVNKNDGFEVAVISPNACTGITTMDAVVQVAGNAACIPTVNAIPDVCPPLIFGSVAKENGELIRKTTTINVTGAISFCPDIPMPALDCAKDFSLCACNFSPSSTYTVTPENDYCDVNGVTTFDLVLITKHILYIVPDPLDTPYKLIAADANNSGSVTTFDLVEIRKLILGIYTSFPNNTSWRFVDKDFVFPNPANPWDPAFPAFPESKTIHLGQPANFVGVKIGDINLSNDCSACLGENFSGATEDRGTQNPLYPINIAMGRVKKGDVITLPFKANGSEELIAYQMGLSFEPAKLEFIGASKGDLGSYSKGNLGLTDLNLGMIRTLWFTAEEQETGVVSKGTVLFNLSFRALENVADIASLLRLDDAVLPNLGFNREGKAYSLALSPAKVDAPANGTIAQPVKATCFPNPFSNTLGVSVSVPEACKGSIWLFDAFGRRLAYQEVSLTKGDNLITIDQAATLAPGVLNWQVRTPFGQVSGVVVKQK